MRFWKILLGIVVIGAVGWLGWYITRPIPGTKMTDQGREHVSGAEVAAYQYNSNPPTSGPHLPTWVKAGVYEAPQSEGELIHALEHGYIIISYNCNVHLKSQKSKVKSHKVYAHEESASAEATADKEGSPSAAFVDPTIATGSPSTGSTKLTTSPLGVNAVNESDGCKTLVKQLTEVANQKKFWKLIVVPRSQLDTTIALTAWTYIDKFDQFDAGRIERFIDYHRDQGPEKTME